jgi:hypothetical protein
LCFTVFYLYFIILYNTTGMFQLKPTSSSLFWNSHVPNNIRNENTSSANNFSTESADDVFWTYARIMGLAPLSLANRVQIWRHIEWLCGRNTPLRPICFPFSYKHTLITKNVARITSRWSTSLTVVGETCERVCTAVSKYILQYLHKLSPELVVSFIVTWRNIKVRLSLHLIKQHTRKEYWRVEVQRNSYLIASGGDDLLVSRFLSHHLGGKCPSTYLVEAGLAPDLVWKFHRRGRTLVPTGNRTPIVKYDIKTVHIFHSLLYFLSPGYTVDFRTMPIHA